MLQNWRILEHADFSSIERECQESLKKVTLKIIGQQMVKPEGV